MNTLSIIASVVAFAASGLTIRAFQLHFARRPRQTDLFQSAYCLIAAAAYLVQALTVLPRDTIDGMWLLCSLGFGVFFAFATLFSALCYLYGPMSLTSVIVNSSVALPVLFGCLILGEPITVPQLIGCALLMITFILSATQGGADETNRRISPRWLFFVAIAFVSNGATAIIQKQYKLSAPQAGGHGFMSAAYLTASLVLIVSFLIKRRLDARIPDGNRAETPRAPLSGARLAALLGLVAVAGLGSFAGNGILLRLSTRLPASLLYPFVNGGLCIVVSVFSVLLFGEKLTRQKVLVIAVGLLSVIALNL